MFLHHKRGSDVSFPINHPIFDKIFSLAGLHEKVDQVLVAQSIIILRSRFIRLHHFIRLRDPKTIKDERLSVDV